MLYVTNTADNTVSVLDRVTNSLISVIQVGRSPKGVVVDPRGTYAYVANSGSNTVSIIDTMTNEIEDTIDLPLGIAPSGIAITRDGNYVFTANTESDNVSMIDTDLKKVIDTIRVGNRPVDLQVSPHGEWLYVSNQGSHDIYVIGLEGGRQLADRIQVQSEPAGIAVGENRIFVANFDSSSVSLFDIKLAELSQGKSRSAGHSVEKSSILKGEYGPVRIVLDEVERRIYVTNQKDNSVSTFMTPMTSSLISESANIQESRYQVGKRPTGLALDSARNYLYVVNSGENSVSVIDLRRERVVESIKVGGEPFGIDGIDLIRK
jgi:YVTN family beta-propeller protein